MVKNRICLMDLSEYSKLMDSGMFWELYPEATGEYLTDKAMSAQGKFRVEDYNYIQKRKIVFKSRYGDTRTLEKIDDKTWKISGISNYIRILGSMEAIDYEGGPYLEVGMDLKTIGGSGIIKSITSINENKEMHEFLITTND